MVGGIVAIFAISLGGAYFITLSWILMGLFKGRQKTEAQKHESPFVSIVVVARDEEKT
jgi:hypothetical protein